jgi:hypothetical protein
MEETVDSQTSEPVWATFSDVQLLQMRICDLRVRLESGEIEPQVEKLYRELTERGLAIRPLCYLGDEWFSPEGTPAIAIPFYLAHPRLKALELKQMLDVEGGTPEWCMRLLRHECGHAMDHAYGFSAREEWREVFGDRTAEYDPETYRPRPYSRSYVRHLPNWYAQSHPDEDFAETFAVWLAMPVDVWQAEYGGWKALEKLEYVDRLMQEAAATPPKVSRGRRISEASKLKRTLERYYAERRRRFAEDFPDFYDADLQAIFGKTGTEPAHKLMRRNKQALINSIVHWTGQPKYTVDQLVTQLVKRARELNLKTSNGDMRVNFDLAAYLATLVTNYLHTGKFKRLV